MHGFRSIRWRIVVPFCLLTAAILAVLYFYTLSQFRQFHLDQHGHHLGAEALLLSGHGQLRDGLAESRWQAGDSDLVRLVRAWSSLLDSRVTIVLADGSVLADSQADTSTMASQLEQPEILAALAEGTGYSVRTSRAFGTEMLYAAAAIVPQGDDPGNADSGEGSEAAVGVLRVSVPSFEVDSALDPLRRTVLVVMLLAYSALVGIVLVISSGTARPFRHLIQAAARLAQGELGVPIEPKGTDEAGQLAKVFNRMRDRLESQVASVSRERERLTSVLDNLLDGVFILDGEGRVRLCNLVAVRMVGLETRKSTGSAAESEEVVEMGDGAATYTDSPDSSAYSNFDRQSLRGQPLAQIVRDHRIVETWEDCRHEGKQAESIFQWGNRTIRVIALPFVRRRQRRLHRTAAGHDGAAPT